jgi:hypothetical protein
VKPRITAGEAGPQYHAFIQGLISQGLGGLVAHILKPPLAALVPKHFPLENSVELCVCVCWTWGHLLTVHLTVSFFWVHFLSGSACHSLSSSLNYPMVVEWFTRDGNWLPTMCE